MLLIVTVLVVVAILLLIVYKKTQEPDDIIPTPGADSTNDDGTCVGVDDLADVSYDNVPECIVNPRNGMCIFDDLELVDGCCVLKTNQNSEATEIAISISSVVVAMAAADVAAKGAVSGARSIAKTIATRVVARITGRTVAQVQARMAASITATAANKAAARIASKAAVKAAWRVGVAAGAKASAKATMMAAKASMGPVGWAMVALDAVSITLDITDPQGYSTFMSNKYLKDMRDYTEIGLYETFSQTDYGWPIIFDIKNMYFDEFVAAYEYAKIPFIEKAMEEVLECKTLEEKLDIGSWFGDYNNRVLQYLNREPEKRDEKIFAKMVELIGDESGNIKLYPFLSTVNKVGISLSEAGVEAWNALTEDKKIELLNESDPDGEPLTEDIFKDFKLVMAHTYRVPDEPISCRSPHKLMVDHMIQAGKEVGNFFSGGKVDTTECVPNMNDRTFPEEVPMYILGFSEDICLHGTDGLIKETTGVCGNYQGEDFGVTWNPNTNLCNYTRAYCDRMALDYNSTTKDCELYPGQDEVELFFPTGTTITRNVMRYGIAVKNCDSEEVRRSKGYPDEHTCRMGELTLVGNEIRNYSAIDACNDDHGGYRNADECMAARSLQALASSAMYFVPGGFMAKIWGGDCDLQWAKPMIEGIINAANETGEFFEEDFVDFFEDDVANALNPTKW